MKRLQDFLNFIFRILLFYGRFVKLRRKIAHFKHNLPDAFKPLDKTYEKRHIQLWQPLAPWVNVSWLRFYTNVSGIKDHMYVPEDIFYAVIERRLNDSNYVRHVGYKNNYEMLFGKGYFPDVVLRKISGIFMDEDYNLIAPDRIDRIFANVSGDVIVKPAAEAGGGTNVSKYNIIDGLFCGSDGVRLSFTDLDDKYRDHYIVQHVVHQHEVLAGFNPSSVNTVRVFTYRSVKDDGVHFIKTVLRMGRRNMIVDNQRAGGISCGVFGDGSLNDFAVSKYGERFYTHPDSKFKFKGLKIPHFDRVLEAVRYIARRIPALRLLSFDIALENSGEPKVIEINTGSMEINFLQCYGGALFGDFTEEIIDFCCRHKDRDNLRVFRFLRT